MKLIDNWRQAWRMLSVQVAILAIVWGALPVDQQAAILALFGVGPERVPLVIDLIGAVLGGMLAIIGVGGLIVGGVIWLGHRAMQRQAADMADEAGESDQQAQRPIWRPGSDK